MTFSKALVLVDQQNLATTQRDAPVIKRARALQKAFGCSLKLLCCVDDQALTPSLVADFEERLADLAQGGDVVGAIFSAADPVEAITSAVQDSEADLVVKQVEASNAYHVGLADHPDWRLMRSDLASVWFVKPSTASIDRVVAAVGHSSEKSSREHSYLDENSYRVYHAARSMARGLSSELEAIHVVEGGQDELPGYDIAAAGNIMAYSEADSADSGTHEGNAKANFHGRQLSWFAEHVYNHGAQLDVRAGATEDVLADYSVETDADLLVLGPRPMSRWERLRASPVAEPVLADAPCDVLAVNAGP